jgi:hypothetical protein
MKTAICCAIKDERYYLKEWIDYHLAKGIDYIHLYEDIGSESHRDICECYSNVYLHSLDECIKIDVNDGYKQKKLFTYFIEHYKDKYDWVAFIDIDEFIFTENNKDIKGILSEYSDKTGIFMFWKMFNSNGLINNPSHRVVGVFTEEYPLTKSIDFPFKSFVNLKMKPIMETHHKVKDGVNVFMGDEKTVTYKTIWLNHYFTKSWDEWCEMILKRGDIIKGHRKITDFFEINPDMEYLKKDILKIIAKKFKGDG